MNLGVCVIDDRYRDTVVALLQNARNRQWAVRCFLTDRGVLMLRDAEFRSLLGDPGIHFSVCELSIERHSAEGISAHDFEDSLVVGGQYQNAELMRLSDRVLVF